VTSTFARKLASIASITLMAWTAGAAAADEPQPMRIVVGFAPGGTTDVIARLVAKDLAARLGRPVIVDNRPGASGNIGAAAVAKAAPDGSTLLFAPSSHATNATLYASKLQFDTQKDFAAVGMVATTPYVLAVHPSTPARTVAELVSYLKASPGKIAYASAGAGTGQHLAGELFKRSSNVDVIHVPYKGSAAAFSDVMSGQTPIVFENITFILPHLKSGSLRPLGVTSPKRSPLLPDVPTIAESGLPGFAVSGWFVLLAPSKTPRPLIAKLNEALNATANDAAFTQKLNDMGAEVWTTTPEKTDAFLKDDIEKWHSVIQKANITVN
jgi:tripartite-type tricarboxylate transporter receptor subunit TctC